MGGKVDPDENYALAALREAREEVGDTDGSYISPQMEYKGTFIFRGGYTKDWVSQFYKFIVPHKNLPGEIDMSEGELFWQHKDKFHEIENLIWDLPPTWDVIIDDNVTFQMIAHQNDDMEWLRIEKTVIHEDGYLVKTEVYEPDKEGVAQIVETTLYK